MPLSTSPAPWPSRITLAGRVVRLEPLDANAHTDALFPEVHGPAKEHVWRYLGDGPYDRRDDLHAALAKKAVADDAVFLAIVDSSSNLAVGYASYMRIDPPNRVIEVGNVLFTPSLQGTTGATEAMYLMARHAFDDLGYRRYEWKCNALNEPSRRAALRFGFSFEGIFRQHMIIKGANRDTAWYAMLDGEWPDRKRAFEEWLRPSNFDAEGRQRQTLAQIRVRV